jgi:YD repeat-containing protein
LTRYQSFSVVCSPYEYYLAGDRTTLTRYSDLAGTQLTGSTTYAGYDGVGRLTAMTHRDGVNAVIASYNMAYDRGHRLVTGSHVNQFVSQNQTYGYDTAGQITSLVRTDGGATMETFSYDTSGNRTAATGVAYTNTNYHVRSIRGGNARSTGTSQRVAAF